MKPGLKRIEATLDQLGVQNDSPAGIAADPLDFSSAVDRNWDEPSSSPPARAKSKVQVESFPLPGNPDAAAPTASPVVAKEQAEAKLPVLPATSPANPPAHNLPAHNPPAHNPNEPVAAPVQDASPSVPNFPASQLPGLGVNRQAANPNLAIGLLKEIETLVRGWQKELEQTVQQIQVVYQDGPIVDGWLESYPPGGQVAPASASVSMLRHAEIEYLMEFIEQICEAEQAQITEDMRRTSYRLCGLDPDGNLWWRSCPSEQVPYVSLAIARYQKLRSLLTKKQTLENRLTSLVESLTMLHGQSREG